MIILKLNQGVGPGQGQGHKSGGLTQVYLDQDKDMGFTKVGIIIILKLNLGVRVMSWEDQPELTYFF